MTSSSRRLSYSINQLKGKIKTAKYTPNNSGIYRYMCEIPSLCNSKSGRGVDSVLCLYGSDSCFSKHSLNITSEHEGQNQSCYFGQNQYYQNKIELKIKKKKYNQ